LLGGGDFFPLWLAEELRIVLPPDNYGLVSLSEDDAWLVESFAQALAAGFLFSTKWNPLSLTMRSASQLCDIRSSRFEIVEANGRSQLEVYVDSKGGQELLPLDSTIRLTLSPLPTVQDFPALLRLERWMRGIGDRNILTLLQELFH